MKRDLITFLIAGFFLFIPIAALASNMASNGDHASPINPMEPLALATLIVFLIGYILVVVEEVMHLPKSIPMMFAAGMIWVLIGILGAQHHIDHEEVRSAVLHGLDEYAALALFLLVAMTYINAITERGVFDALKVWLLRSGFNYRSLFWITGILAFFISPIADNMTTALIMGTVIITVGSKDTKFISLGMVNVVVAANSGGAFSPFGDITTLMVWQAGHVEFFTFFKLFIPSLVSWIIPAFIMSLFVPKAVPEKSEEQVKIKRGGLIMVFLFMLTIAMAVSFEQILGVQPFLGMMTGLSFLLLLTWFVKKTGTEDHDTQIDIFDVIARSEWDTLMFFFGVIFAVGGLAYLGYLTLVSDYMYIELGASTTHIIAGLASSIIDNIPIMFAILSMDPQIDLFQWLLITLTAGIGGSLFSVGSAAGVALMGQANGIYTFGSHIKWSWTILLGYIGGIAAHFLVNANMVTIAH